MTNLSENGNYNPNLVWINVKPATISIDLLLNGIPFDAKSIGKG